MSEKQKLLKTLQEFKKVYSDAQAKIANINANPELTPEGKEKQSGRVSSEFYDTAKTYHDLTANIVNTGIESVRQKWEAGIKNNLTNAGYQTGLANALAFIENGYVSQPEYVQAIVSAYKNDSVALAALRDTFLKAGNKDLAALVPAGNEGKNIQLLQQLRSNIDRYVSAEFLQSKSNWSLATTTMSIDSMCQFVDTRLSDDFSLIEQ